MCGATLPVANMLAEFRFVAGEFVGSDVLKLEAQHVHTLDQNEVERNCAG